MGPFDTRPIGKAQQDRKLPRSRSQLTVRNGKQGTAMRKPANEAVHKFLIPGRIYGGRGRD